MRGWNSAPTKINTAYINALVRSLCRLTAFLHSLAICHRILTSPAVYGPSTLFVPFGTAFVTGLGVSGDSSGWSPRAVIEPIWSVIFFSMSPLVDFVCAADNLIGQIPLHTGWSQHLRCCQRVCQRALNNVAYGNELVWSVRHGQQSRPVGKCRNTVRRIEACFE
jgi:hypothetical protein